jgi:hypothetical protein
MPPRARPNPLPVPASHAPIPHRLLPLLSRRTFGPHAAGVVGRGLRILWTAGS